MGMRGGSSGIQMGREEEIEKRGGETRDKSKFNYYQ